MKDRHSKSLSLIQSSRQKFQTEYRAKKFRDAIGILEAKMTSCKKFIASDDLAQMRSDLSVAAFHAGDRKKYLEEIRQARKEDPDIEPGALGNLPFAPIYDPIRKVSRALSFNEKKCSLK